MAPVFEHADHLFELLNSLVRRPAKGEAPREMSNRDGIPVVRLLGHTGTDNDELAESIRAALGRAESPRIPHEFVSVPDLWDEVRADRDDLPADWQPVELSRRVLVALAQEYSSASNGRDGRIRFRRFGLVNWLLQTDYAGQEPDPQHDQDLLRGLRDREFKRRRLFGVLRSPDTEVALQQAGRIPWWVLLLGLHVFPIVWFRAWRGVGVEYRWLLHQPFMAPRDPGTFVGFAMRLTQPRWFHEVPEQACKLMINAFLEDLRAAYRRRLWKRRAWRRTAYCVAFLKDVSDDNHGNDLLRLLIEVRNATGQFDPLLIIGSGEPTGRERRGHGELSEDLYGIWRNRFREAGRSRSTDAWYLPVRVPSPLPESHDSYELHNNRLQLANRFRVDAVPPWARRRVTVLACALVLTLLGGSLLVAFNPVAERRWQAEHCGLSRSNPDAATLWREPGNAEDAGGSDGDLAECVGVAAHGYAFGSQDKQLQDTLDTIAAQNGEADRIHRRAGRPVVTLVHISALLSSAGHDSSSLSYGREALQGVASAQRRQLDKRDDNEPVLRIYPASAGRGMKYGPKVVPILAELKRRDPSIVGVTCLDQSRKATLTTIGALTRIGLPMVATTLSADSLAGSSPLYYQVSPQNRRESAVAAAHAAHLAAPGGRLAALRVRTVYSADPTDEYSKSLRADASRSFKEAGFAVEDRSFRPSNVKSDDVPGPGGRTVGGQSCDYPGLIFFAGRAEDFDLFLAGVNDACGSSPPAILGGDDVARFAADRERRSAYPRIPYDFLDFTPGTTSCDSESNLYSTMRTLFPAECREQKVQSTSLDGHAALSFDAVNLYLKAIGQLQDTAPGLPLSAAAVWHALSGIHGRNGALDGESGKIDFGGLVDAHVPLDKLISVQRVEGAKSPRQVGFCGRLGREAQGAWCPEPEQQDASGGGTTGLSHKAR